MNELIGNVNLSDHNNYQAIYSSQLYGTFFMVYAKFDCNPYDNQKGGYLLKKIELKLINYKGLLNLGIIECNFKPFIKNRTKTASNGTKTEIKTPFGGTIRMKVKALHSSNPNDLIIDSINHYCPKKSYIKVERIVQRINSNPNKSMTNEVFDEEFFYREGVKKDFTLKRNKRSLIKPDEVYSSASGAGGSICPKSKNKIV